MLAVVLDTNAIYADPWLASEPGEQLLQLAEDGACVVVYPQVVIDELLRQRREGAQRAHDLASKGLEDMAKAGVDVAQTRADLGANLDRIAADLDEAFARVLARPNVSSARVPHVPTENLLRRDLDRRRPFMEIEIQQKMKSVGFRDTLIWETVLESLTGTPGYYQVLFVAADKGFLSDDKRTLHGDLLDDLDARSVARDRVTTVKNVFNVIAEVEAAATAAQITAATDALYALVGEGVETQLQQGGDYDYPDFVEFEVPALESGNITYIDQTSEFELTEQGSVAIATCEAQVYIEGAVYKADWYIDETGSVSISGELNRHYFDASAEVSVHVVVELDTSGGSIDVVRIVLRDLPAGESESD